MKTVFITGVTSGFGYAMAEKFIKEGWQVVGTGRRQQRLDELSTKLGSDFCGLCFDISSREQTENAVKSLPEGFQNISVLVNNAGLALGTESAEKCSIEEWETMVDTNIKGLLYITAALLPSFVEKKEGHIINIGSIAGNYAYPGGNVYGGTKAFVNMFSLHLRADMVDKYVRVTSVEPGLCETEFSVVRFRGSQDKANSVYTGVEAIRPEDVAETVYWSVSMPKHVNVNRVELMATQQAFAPFAIHRES